MHARASASDDLKNQESRSDFAQNAVLGAKEGQTKSEFTLMHMPPLILLVMPRVALGVSSCSLILLRTHSLRQEQ